MKRITLTAAILLATVTAASAVTLINKDSKSYDIRVKGTSSTMSTSISGGTTKGGICSSCKIIVKGVGEIEATGSDKVIIKGGHLSK